MNEHINNTPDWVKNVVFYQIFPDRFAWSNKVVKPGKFENGIASQLPTDFEGGDLLGVYEKLDYLEDLGINAIYFNPFSLPPLTIAITPSTIIRLTPCSVVMKPSQHFSKERISATFGLF